MLLFVYMIAHNCIKMNHLSLSSLLLYAYLEGSKNIFHLSNFVHTGL